MERDLLTKLNNPCLNFKTLDCPEYDKLEHIIPKEKLLRNCGLHKDGVRQNLALLGFGKKKLNL